jgi:hypothetical protein
VSPRATHLDAQPDALASDVKALGINLRDLQVRIEAAADLEALPLTDARLAEIEAVRAAIASLEDIITRGRNRAVASAVAARWPYKRIQRANTSGAGRVHQPVQSPAEREAGGPPTPLKTHPAAITASGAGDVVFLPAREPASRSAGASRDAVLEVTELAASRFISARTNASW